MLNQDYLRAVLRAVAVSTDRGKRPARSVVLNAASAALNLSDRTGLDTALEQLIATGMVGERNGRLVLTEKGRGSDSSLEADADKRLADHLSVTFKTAAEGLDQDQQETLFLVAVADHHRRMIGVHSIALARDESITAAQNLLDGLVEGGYLDPVTINHHYGAPIAVYGLTRAGKFELRRGELRMDSIRYPSAQSPRARELILTMDTVLSDD